MQVAQLAAEAFLAVVLAVVVLVVVAVMAEVPQLALRTALEPRGRLTQGCFVMDSRTPSFPTRKKLAWGWRSSMTSLEKQHPQLSRKHETAVLYNFFR